MASEQKIDLTLRVNSETGQLDIVSDKLRQTGEAAKKTEGDFFKLGQVGNDLLKIFGAQFTTRAVLDFFKSSIREAEEMNQSLRRLSFNVEATGQSWSRNSKRVQEWAQTLQETTRFSDNQALSSLERFVRVSKNLEQAMNASTLAMDISVSTGKDLGQVQELLVNLINRNERSIREARREFGALTGNLTDQDKILQKLIEKFSGAAAQEKTLTSETEKLAHSWDDMKKTLGQNLMPALEGMVGLLNKAIDGYKRLQEIQEKNKKEGFISRKDGGVFDDEKRREEKLTEVKQEEANKRVIITTNETREELMTRIRSYQVQHDAHVKESENYLQLEQMKKDFTEKALEDALKKYEEDTTRMQNVAKQVANQIPKEFGKAFAEIIMDGKNFEDAFTDIFNNLLRMALELIAQALVLKALKSTVFGPAGFMGLFAPGYSGAGVSRAPGGLFGAPDYERTEREHGNFVLQEVQRPQLQLEESGASAMKRRQDAFLADQAKPGGSSSININVMFAPGRVDLNNVDMILKRLTQEILAETTHAVKFAVASRGVATRNSRRAV